MESTCTDVELFEGGPRQSSITGPINTNGLKMDPQQFFCHFSFQFMRAKNQQTTFEICKNVALSTAILCLCFWSRKVLAYCVCGTYAAHFSLVHDITDAEYWVKHGSTRHVLPTFRLRF